MNAPLDDFQIDLARIAQLPLSQLFELNNTEADAEFYRQNKLIDRAFDNAMRIIQKFWVRRWLETRKRNKRRPAFARAWRKR